MAPKKEMEQLAAQFDAHEQQIKDLTLERMNAAPKEDVEPQTKLSQKQIDQSKDIYLKPVRTIGSREPFNEKWREDYNFAKEYVQFIAENKEVIGESIEAWTKKFPGQPAEFWRVPVNKPVWGPRYLAEQIRAASYHRFSMDESKMTNAEGGTTYYGQMVVDNTIARLTAEPVSTRKSIFMGASL